MYGSINFAYNKLCDSPQVSSKSDGRFFNHYANLYTYINGDDFERLFKFPDNRQFTCTITRHDYHILPETILSTQFKVNRKKLSDIILTHEKFVYTISPRYMIKLIEDDIHKNFLKDLLTPEHVYSINNKQCLFIINDMSEASFYTDKHYETLKNFCDQIQLDIEKVIIFTSNDCNVRRLPFKFNVVFWPFFECVTKRAYNFYMRHTYTHFTKITKKYSKYRMLLLNANLILKLYKVHMRINT